MSLDDEDSTPEGPTGGSSELIPRRQATTSQVVMFMMKEVVEECVRLNWN